jgi:uncharacterized protein (DUF488 family)
LPNIVFTNTVLPNTVFTIGHSTRTLDDFIAVLKAHGIGRVADIRTLPRSRANPQFNIDSLPDELARHEIAYGHDPRLGGLRHPLKDSLNTGWKNARFRGYADHMNTPEFRAALDDLIEAARGGRIALMCAEAVPWRCHRSLVADALTARGLNVQHVMSARIARPHKMSSFLRLQGDDLSYPE